MPPEKVEPCPFCGGGDIREGHIPDGREVACSGPAGCGASVHAHHGPVPAMEAAWAKWNRRERAGPKYALNEEVEMLVRAEVSGVKVEQRLRFWVVSVKLGSSTDRLLYTYDLSTDPPRPYHAWSGVQFAGVAEADLRPMER